MGTTAIEASGPLLTLLDHSETSEPKGLIQQNEQRDHANRVSVSFRHSGTSHLRNRVIEALGKEEPSFKVIQRVQECGQFARVQKSKEENPRFRIRCDRCHHRFCPACSMEKSRLMSHALLKKIGEERVRFLTLTLKHRDEPLGRTTDRILRSFKELRRSKLWKRNVTSGIAFIEVKRSTGWHVHLHILITGHYLPFKDLREKWLEITGDSFIIDIRNVTRKGEIVNYVTKYVSKPLDRSVVLHAQSLREAIRELKGRRLVLTFGDWRGWRITDSDNETEWIDVDSLASIIRRAGCGDATAGWILRGLTDADPSSYLATIDSG